jgi:hypothetical protein
MPLLEKAVPCSWWQIPILPGPLLEVNCLNAPASQPHTTFLPTGHLFTCRDINMPTPPVGHKKSILRVVYLTNLSGNLYLLKLHVSKGMDKSIQNTHPAKCTIAKYFLMCTLSNKCNAFNIMHTYEL